MKRCIGMHANAASCTLGYDRFDFLHFLLEQAP